MAPTNCNVLLVFPRFNPNSFWSFKGACEVWGARCPAPPLGLITLAGLLPSPWNLRLVDRNAEELTDSDLDWADLVMTGGMLPQQLDTLALIELCRARGKPVAVGGPDPTSSPHVYEKADFRVLGEAEGIIDQFIEEWTRGGTKGIFEAKKFTADVTRSPIPRFDLLNLEHYLYVGVQFSRGCPFNCEFCDIIELYGRIPRTKTNEQMLTELDTLYRMGYRGHVDFVDDNLIGNKKALKRFLPVLQEWQKERGYPFKFSTEASINLSDDVELLRMLRDANFFAIFVGIESPDTDTLVSAQKKQNTRRSLAESVHKIYGAGMFVLAGFIVGFDTEKDRVADGMVDCIMATGVPVAMVGLLTALPNTQLSRRLKSEGRLHSDFDVIGERHGDQCTGGLNFVTRKASSRHPDGLPDHLGKDLRSCGLFRARPIGWPCARYSKSPGQDFAQGHHARTDFIGAADVARDGPDAENTVPFLEDVLCLRASKSSRPGLRGDHDGVLPASRHVLTTRNRRARFTSQDD